ncbi:hypothetical protein ACTXT7_012976 [Hymenolepis weldensis]
MDLQQVMKNMTVRTSKIQFGSSMYGHNRVFLHCNLTYTPAPSDCLLMICHGLLINEQRMKYSLYHNSGSTRSALAIPNSSSYSFLPSLLIRFYLAIIYVVLLTSWSSHSAKAVVYPVSLRKLIRHQNGSAREETEDRIGAYSEDLKVSTGQSSSQDAGKILHRATTSVHVCWHRSSTFSMSDILRANEYQTSGYLLRKFKNSNGWQKLWVVFTQLCLFFHKSYQDTFPLASLPLLGYNITTPSPEDNIRKEFVFKLQFKNHVYFFRDDSQTSFERWFDCLSSAAGTSSRQRLISSRHNVTSTTASATSGTAATNLNEKKEK